MEITLYDVKGHPAAYIADDGERSIYLWTGQAVAYIDERENIFGWNGRQLGWLVEGVLYDSKGLRAGSVLGMCQVPPFAEHGKYAKLAKYGKSPPHTPLGRPAFSATFSVESLAEMLGHGAVASV